MAGVFAKAAKNDQSGFSQKQKSYVAPKHCFCRSLVMYAHVCVCVCVCVCVRTRACVCVLSSISILLFAQWMVQYIGQLADHCAMSVRSCVGVLQAMPKLPQVCTDDDTSRRRGKAQQLGK